MLQKVVFKILMMPFALLYGLGVIMYNGLYSLGILKGLRFNVPVISVGNLTVGGAGKTPHVEYIIQWLGQYLEVCVLSRGYRRKTKGYIKVHANHKALDVGDEPLLYKQKFPETTVVVSESRAFAIPKIIGSNPGIRAVILDDAFQHRAVKPGLNLLLTEYDHLFVDDYLLPVGRLRELRSGYKRADIVIISKCPTSLSMEERKHTIDRIKPTDVQRIYFSRYQYGQPYAIFIHDEKLSIDSNMDVILLCALASSEYLVQYVEQQVNELEVIEYEDHHFFNADNIIHLKKRWDLLSSDHKIILTTEKDATRLQLIEELVTDLPIYVLPIEVAFLNEDEERFREDLRNYLLEFKV